MPHTLNAMPRGGPPVQPKWGRIIQQRREDRGWSLRWAATQSGMSDVFFAQMERGWKRKRDGSYQEVTPSLGSLLQAAAALRFTDAETDQLVASAGHAPLPRRAHDGSRPSVVEALENDPHLIDEARQHMIQQYELLRRITPATPAARGKASRRAAAASDDGLRAVARGGDTAHRGEVRQLAKKARAEHDDKESRGKGK